MMDRENHQSGSSSLGSYFACRRRGALHEQSGQPCQDAFAVWSGVVQDQPLLLVAVADGHGDAKHDLSEYGAKLAVNAAIESLHALFDAFGHSRTELYRSFRHDFPRIVVRKWRETVLIHAAHLGIEADEEQSQQLYSRYGTTLLVGLVTSEDVLLGQLGDGDILLIDETGDVLSPFTSKSEELIGNMTHSLSSTDAYRLWATTRLSHPTTPALLMMSTDGLSNCFEDDSNFHLFGRSLLTRLQEYGLDNVAGELPGWLDYYSNAGSGDDITLSFILFHSDLLFHPEQVMKYESDTAEQALHQEGTPSMEELSEC